MQSLGYYGRVIDCAMTAPSLPPSKASVLLEEPHLAGKVRPRDRPSSAKPPSPACEVPRLRQRPLSATIGGKAAKMTGPYAVLLKNKVPAESGRAWASKAEEDSTMIPSFDDDDDSWEGEQPSREQVLEEDEDEEASPSPALRPKTRSEDSRGALRGGQRRSPSLGSPRRVAVRAAPSPILSSAAARQAGNNKENKAPHNDCAVRTTTLPPATRVRARRALDTGSAHAAPALSGDTTSGQHSHASAGSEAARILPVATGQNVRARSASPSPTGKGNVTSSREEMERLMKELNRRVEASDGEHRTTRGENAALKRQLNEAKEAQDSLAKEMARMLHQAEQLKGERDRVGETRTRLECLVSELSEENARLGERIREMTEIACRRTREHEAELASARGALRAATVQDEAEIQAMGVALEDARSALGESERERAAERARLEELLNEKCAYIAGEEARRRPLVIVAARRASAALVGSRRRECARQALAAWEDAVLNYPSERGIRLERGTPLDKQREAKGTPSDSVASAMSTPRLVWAGKGGSPGASSTASSGSGGSVSARSYFGSTPGGCEAGGEGLGAALSGVGGMVGNVRRLDALFENCLSGGAAAAKLLFPSGGGAKVEVLAAAGREEEGDACEALKGALGAWRGEVQRGGRMRRIVSRWEGRRQTNAMAAAFMGWADVA